MMIGIAKSVQSQGRTGSYFFFLLWQNLQCQKMPFKNMKSFFAILEPFCNVEILALTKADRSTLPEDFQKTIFSQNRCTFFF